MEETYWYIIFFLFLYLFLKNKKQNKKNPPSPLSLPIIGHLHLIKEPLHHTLENLSTKYGDILLLRFGLKKVLLVCSPSAVQECFTKNDTIFANRPVSMASTHLSYDFTTITVAPYGDLWRNLRRLAAVEIFSPHRIAFFTDLRDKEVMLLVLLVAGTDTLSLTMEWAMALLVNHPESIEKVRAEIEAHVPKDRLLAEQDLPKLSYLQNVITETLRLHPPLPFLIPHECSADCTVGGYNVSRGTMLLVNVRAIHRDPKAWPKPDEFIPERHECEGEEMLIPFGAGRRSCPGAGLGKRVLGLALGRLIQAFEWERIGVELEEMTEGPGFSTPKIKPLEAICKPRAAATQYSLF